MPREPGSPGGGLAPNMGPIPPAPQPRYISQVRPGPDLCTPLPSARHTEVVYRDRGGREIYICDVAAWAHATNWSIVPAHPLPAHFANWPIVPVELLPFLAARPKPEAPRASPSSSPSDPPRPGPRPTKAPPARQLASLPLRPPSGLAPAHRPGCPGRAETPPPAANAPGPVGRRLYTVGGYLGTGRDREAGPPGSPCQGPLPPVPPCPTHPSNAPHPHHRPASIWARTVGPGSPLHRLTDHIWVIKRHATLSGARKCWWGTYLYRGGPCTAFLHTK